MAGSAGIVAIVGKTDLTLKDTSANDPKVQAAINYLNAETDALRNAGFPDEQVMFNLVKDWMESGAYTSTGSKLNNPGNIMFGAHNIRATKGAYLKANKSYLAAYVSLNDYAADLKRVLSLKPGVPYSATGYPDLRDFVHRLALNHYFGSESESSYLAKMQAAQQRLRIINQVQADTHQDIVVSTGHDDKLTQWWDGLSNVEKIGVGVGTFVAAAILLKS